MYQKAEGGKGGYLAIEAGGIVPRPEEREEVGVGAHIGVELDPNHLHMVGGSGADELIGWVRDVALREPHLRLHHPNKALKRKLHPPEAPCSELSQLQTRVVWAIRIPFQSRVSAVGRH